jgi:hypothetical protein
MNELTTHRLKIQLDKEKFLVMQQYLTAMVATLLPRMISSA